MNDYIKLGTKWFAVSNEKVVNNPYLYTTWKGQPFVVDGFLFLHLIGTKNYVACKIAE